MSKANCDANEVLKLQAEIERLEAEAAAMRAALEEIKEEAETDLDRDIILTACESALFVADAGRPMLERLRRAENAIQEMLGTYTPGERAKLLALWNGSLRSHIPDVEPEHGHLSSLYAFVSMATQAMLELAEAGNVARGER